MITSVRSKDSRSGLRIEKVSSKQTDTPTHSSEENADFQMYSAKIRELLRMKYEAGLMPKSNRLRLMLTYSEPWIHNKRLIAVA